MRENGFYWVKEKHPEAEWAIAEWSCGQWYFILDDIGRDEDEIIAEFEIGERIQPPMDSITP